MRTKRSLIAIFLFLFFGSCHYEPRLRVSFTLVKLSEIDNKKAIRVAIENNNDKNVFVLASYLVNKLDSIHPCRNDILGEYSKISSHTGNDCIFNPGILLFDYLMTRPFNRIDHVKLKNTLSASSEKDEFGIATIKWTKC